MKLSKINNLHEWNNWDRFIQSTPETSFLSYSFWLNTYLRIPFLIKKIGFVRFENERIVEGISGIKIGIGSFARIIFPSGPYGVDNNGEEFIINLLKLPEIANARFVQFASPFPMPLVDALKSGKRLKHIYLDPGFGNISLENDAEEQLNIMKYKVTRYIKASLKRGLSIEWVNSTDRLNDVYMLFKRNAQEAKYRIRPYSDYRKSWKHSMSNGRSLFALVKHDGSYKGAIWLIDCGQSLHYIMGGTSKEKPRIDAGYFLHWHAILESIKRGYKSYNISVGGSDSVEQFKDDFGRNKTNHIHYYYCENGKSKK